MRWHEVNKAYLLRYCISHSITIHECDVNTLIHTLIRLQQDTSLLVYSVRKPSTIPFWWSDFQNWRHFHAYFSLSHFPFSLFHLFHWLKHSSWMIKHFATNTLKLIRAIDKTLLLRLLVYVCELAHNLEKDVRYAISKKKWKSSMGEGLKIILRIHSNVSHAEYVCVYNENNSNRWCWWDDND